MNTYFAQITRLFRGLLYLNLTFHALELFLGGYASFFGTGKLFSLEKTTFSLGLAVFAFLAIWLFALRDLTRKFQIKSSVSGTAIFFGIIVPVLNFFAPFLMVKSFWNEFKERGESLSGQEQGKEVLPPTYIWWGSFLVSGVFYTLYNFALYNGELLAGALNNWTILAKISLMVSAWYLLVVVNRMSLWVAEIQEQQQEPLQEDGRDLDDFMFRH